MICLNCKEETNNPKFCCRSCGVSFNNRGKRRRGNSKICSSCSKKISRKATTGFCHSCYILNKSNETFRRIENGEIFSDGTIKKYLVYKDNRCQECGSGPKWNNKILTLQMDHIDGDSDNWNINNLRLLCPNCHTQTETWCFRNIKNSKR